MYRLKCHNRIVVSLLDKWFLCTIEASEICFLCHLSTNQSIFISRVNIAELCCNWFKDDQKVDFPVAPSYYCTMVQFIFGSNQKLHSCRHFKTEVRRHWKKIKVLVVPNSACHLKMTVHFYSCVKTYTLSHMFTQFCLFLM